MATNKMTSCPKPLQKILLKHVPLTGTIDMNLIKEVSSFWCVLNKMVLLACSSFIFLIFSASSSSTLCCSCRDFNSTRNSSVCWSSPLYAWSMVDWDMTEPWKEKGCCGYSTGAICNSDSVTKTYGHYLKAIWNLGGHNQPWIKDKIINVTSIGMHEMHSQMCVDWGLVTVFVIHSTWHPFIISLPYNHPLP